jgi:hypothetical protein
MKQPALTAFLLLSLTAPTAAHGEEILLDETAVVVAARIPSQQSVSIVTRWEVEARCRLESVRRYGKEGVDRKIGDELRSAVLDKILDETVVSMEMSRLGFEEIDKGLVLHKLQEYVETFESEEDFFEALEEYSISRKQVLTWIKRSLLVERYIDAQYYMTGARAPGGGEEEEGKKGPFRMKLIEEIKNRYRIWVM